jgi:hypothetical protein
VREPTDEERDDARREKLESMPICDDCGKRTKIRHAGPGGMSICGSCLRGYLPD